MDLITGITVFVLAIFLGFEIITKIPPTLHTPLMSGSNAISGITLLPCQIDRSFCCPNVDSGRRSAFNELSD